jgi:hypothetical protein
VVCVVTRNPLPRERDKKIQGPDSHPGFFLL